MIVMTKYLVVFQQVTSFRALFRWTCVLTQLVQEASVGFGSILAGGSLD